MYFLLAALFSKFHNNFECLELIFRFNELYIIIFFSIVSTAVLWDLSREHANNCNNNNNSLTEGNCRVSAAFYIRQLIREL